MGGRNRRDRMKVGIVRHSKSTSSQGTSSLKSDRLHCDRTFDASGAGMEMGMFNNAGGGIDTPARVK